MFDVDDLGRAEFDRVGGRLHRRGQPARRGVELDAPRLDGRATGDADALAALDPSDFVAMEVIWSPADDRPDPVEVITSQDADRVQGLRLIRHGRMAVSLFTFCRGAA